LTEACRKLEADAEQIEQACERYDPERAASAGVIVAFAAHGPEVQAGLIRPDDQASTAPDSKTEEDAPKKKDFALSRTLVEDLGVERADAIAASLLDQPDLAQDALLFAIAGQALAQDLTIPGIGLRCRPADRCHSRPEARDAATLKAIEDAHRDLDLSWLDQGLSAGQQFLAFQSLEPTMKGRIAAWCLGASISPALVDGSEGHGHDSFVQTLAAMALPDIRTRWLPTEANYWSRVTKGHMLDLLREFGMSDAADDKRSAKKTTLAAYISRLFATPFKTLTPDQDAAVRVWAPNGMHTVAPPSEDTDGEDALAA
jgi:ParB family chromosome partitioning protein